MNVKPQGWAAIAAAAIGFGVAGCGAAKAPGIMLAPSGGATALHVTSTPTTPTTSSTPTTTATPTPTSGPLSHEPSVPKASGPPPSHLVTKDLITGTGTAAKAGSTVTVNYVGALYKNGKVFDSSWSRHQTFGPFALSPSGGVIKGWQQGLVGMKVGGRRELIIPPSLAYGKAGSPPTIPPNATLVFVVDLLSASG
jgi:FKBP-type peptidyl-prolyl cis-trans isomerase